MRQVFSLLFLILLSPPLSASDQHPSIVPLTSTSEDGEMRCTGFSIGEGIFITALHCITGIVAIGVDTLIPIIIDKNADLVALQGRAGTAGLKLGKMPKFGDSVVKVGYPAGFPELIKIPAIFQGEFQVKNFGPPSAIYWGNAMPGMSGGPILNTRGEVVGVIIGGGNPSHPFQNIGTGVRYEPLRKMIKMAEMLK